MTVSPVRSRRRSTIVFTVAVLVIFHLIWQTWLVLAAPYPARYDYDEGVYAATAVAAASANRLYATVFLSQPPLLIGVLVHVFGIFGHSLLVARGVAVGFSVLWLASLAAIAARAGGRRAAVWAVAIAGSAIAFVTASHTVQMEGPSEAFAALAVAIGLGEAGRSSRMAASGKFKMARWGTAGFAAGLALMTKFTAVTCLAPLVSAVAAGAYAGSLRPVAVRAAALAGGALVATAATIVWTGSPLDKMLTQTVVYHSAARHAADPAGVGGAASLLAAFGAANWLLVLLGLAGLAITTAAWRRDAAAREEALRLGAVTAWLAADLAALFWWKPVWAHHLVILVSPLAVLGASAVEAVWRGARRAGGTSTAPGAATLRLLTGALFVCWLAALTVTVAASVPENSAPARAAAEQIERAVPVGTFVVTDDPIVPFLAGRAVPPGLCDTSEMRMRAGWLTAAGLTAALGDPRVRGVVLWRGTFRARFPEFASVAVKEFPRRWSAGNGGEILTR